MESKSELSVLYNPVCVCVCVCVRVCVYINTTCFILHPQHRFCFTLYNHLLMQLWQSQRSRAWTPYKHHPRILYSVTCIASPNMDFYHTSRSFWFIWFQNFSPHDRWACTDLKQSSYRGWESRTMCVNSYTDRSGGRSRTACWWAGVLANLWSTASACLLRRMLTGPRSWLRLLRRSPRSFAEELGYETSLRISWKDQPGGQEWEAECQSRLWTLIPLLVTACLILWLRHIKHN